MYPKAKYRRTSIDRNEGFEGESIEQKMERIVNNKEPIEDGSPIIYTDRAEGVRPETNIRTDRFDNALDAKDKIDADAYAKREERIREYNEKRNPKKGDEDTKGESTQGTSESASEAK